MYETYTKDRSNTALREPLLFVAKISRGSDIFSMAYHLIKFNNFHVLPFFLCLSTAAEIGHTG